MIVLQRVPTAKFSVKKQLLSGGFVRCFMATKTCFKPQSFLQIGTFTGFCRFTLYCRTEDLGNFV